MVTTQEKRLQDLQTERKQVEARTFDPAGFQGNEAKLAKVRRQFSRSRSNRLEQIDANIQRVRLRIQAERRSAQTGRTPGQELKALKSKEAKKDLQRLSPERRKKYEEQRTIIRSEARLNKLNRPSKRRLQRYRELDAQDQGGRIASLERADRIARRNVSIAQNRKAYEAAIGRQVDWSDPTNERGLYRRPLRSGTFDTDAMTRLTGTDRFQRGLQNIQENRRYAAQAAQRIDASAYVEDRMAKARGLEFQGISTAGQLFSAVGAPTPRKDIGEGELYMMTSPTQLRRLSFMQFDAGTGVDQPKPDMYRMFRDSQRLPEWRTKPFDRFAPVRDPKSVLKDPVSYYKRSQFEFSRTVVQPYTPSPEKLFPDMGGGGITGVAQQRLFRGAYREAREKPFNVGLTFAAGAATGGAGGALGLAARGATATRAARLSYGLFRGGEAVVGGAYLGAVGYGAATSGDPYSYLGRESLYAGAFGGGVVAGSRQAPQILGFTRRFKIKSPVSVSVQPTPRQVKSFRFSWGEKKIKGTGRGLVDNLPIVEESMIPGGSFVKSRKGRKAASKLSDPFAKEVEAGNLLAVDIGSRGTIKTVYLDPVTGKPVTSRQVRIQMFKRKTKQLLTVKGKRGQSQLKLFELQTLRRPKTTRRPSSRLKLIGSAPIAGTGYVGLLRPAQRVGTGYLGAFRSGTSSDSSLRIDPIIRPRSKTGLTPTIGTAPRSIIADRRILGNPAASITGTTLLTGGALVGAAGIGLFDFGRGKGTRKTGIPSFPERGGLFGGSSRGRRGAGTRYGLSQGLYSQVFNLNTIRGVGTTGLISVPLSRPKKRKKTKKKSLSSRRKKRRSK